MSTDPRGGVARILVDSRLRILGASALSLDCSADIADEFVHANPAHEAWTAIPPQYRRYRPEPPATIATWRDEPGDVLSVPRGGKTRVYEILKKHGVSAAFTDARSSGALAPYPDLAARHVLKLYDFQVEMVDAALREETCALRAPCGSGKSSVGIALVSRVGVSALIVVPTSKIFDEWVKRLGLELGLSPDEIGWFGNGKKKIRPVTVAMIDTLKRYVDEIAPLFGCVIFDELQRVPSNSYYPAIDALPCRYRVGLSADERRKDGKHGIAYDLFGDVAVDVPQDELISRRIVFAVDVCLVPTEFEAPWYVELPPAQKRRPEIYGSLLEELVEDAERTKIATGLAVAASSSAPVLVFSHRVEHCARLRADIAARYAALKIDYRAGVVLGDKTYELESAETIAGLRAGTVRCAVGTYQSIGTGVDLPNVEIGVAVTPIHANRQNFGQIRDRLCRVDRRPNATKRDATLYLLWDRKVFGDRPLTNMLAWNKGAVTVLEHGVRVDGREFARRFLDENDAGGLIGSDEDAGASNRS